MQLVSVYSEGGLGVWIRMVEVLQRHGQQLARAWAQGALWRKEGA